jgi:hypothetical protein
VLREAVLESDVMGKEMVLERLPGIFETHVRNVCLPKVKQAPHSHNLE